MGYWIVGLDESKIIFEVPNDLKKVLIFGSEGKGIKKF